jgi:metallo-beta-lactamase class B
MNTQRNWFGPSVALGGRLAALAGMTLGLVLLANSSAAAQEVTIPPRADNENVRHDPFRMIGNIYWVGHSQVGSFLIKTSEGLILMDSTSAEESEWTRENIEKLGFSMKDIKLMLNSHPHAEHMGGFAMFKEVTGAKLIASKLTADEMAVGGRTDFREDGSEQYTPVKADQVVEDGGKVTLGDVTLTARITPGHTKGCTTWTTTVQEDGKTYNVLFFCGMATAGIDRAPLLNNPKYPNIVEDYQRAFKLLRTLPCDVPLYPRATTIALHEKQARLNKGEKPNPFVDHALCKSYIDEYQGLFEDQLQQQLAAAAAQKKAGQ